MNSLSLKPTHKAVTAYYGQLRELADLNAGHEGALAPAFAELLRHCARQFDWQLIEQHPLKRNNRTIRTDGALMDKFNLMHGVWEAKDCADDLDKEIKKKFDAGYPSDNILFQAPDRIVIFQNGREVFNDAIINPHFLVRALKTFFEDWRPPEFLEWEKAAEDFKDRVPEIGRKLLKQIELERGRNKKFIAAFNDFFELCKQAINPELSVQAVEEMLIQHLLTERIFRNVFRNADFVNRNIIAREIEKVVGALTSQSFSRDEFLRELDRFYMAIETTANAMTDYSQKQHFLNTIYEKFFQGFSVKVADTHGIVYTPQPIVDFMVRSVEEILQKEFNKSLSDEGVHILDPFVGTGNFLVRIMREIKRHKLLHKYHGELHCNEVMLLPYYIASMNIEHAFYELTGDYWPFEGICLVDTFELAEAQQTSMFTKENTERVNRQKQAPIYVIIGNPPYNAGQVNENDNNKNRKYPAIDERVRETYAKESKATNKNALSDVYVKAFRLASDRIARTGEGIVAFVSNNSFLNEISFDGMRKALGEEFDSVYVLDLGGNVRKNPKLSGTTNNVFGIQVGVSINLLVKNTSKAKKQPAKVYYARMDEFWKKEDKYNFLEEKGSCGAIEWEAISPDKRNTWLTEGMDNSFDEFMPMGTKEAKAGSDKKICFEMFSNGVKTNRDAWIYNFLKEQLATNVNKIIRNYNEDVLKWGRLPKKAPVDDFVTDDETRVSWSGSLKSYVERQIILEMQAEKLRFALYRPFTKQYLYFDEHLVERRYQFQVISPIAESEKDNKVICLSAAGNTKPFHCLMTNIIPDLHLTGDSQCFPFYTYSDSGSDRKENITDWALSEFRSHYSDQTITKWDIFHYIYGLLHHPAYRATYAANLRRSLPRIPFAPDFRGFARAGARLADLHVHYETAPEYPLDLVENKKARLDWRVEKMRLSKDKTQIDYNDFLILNNIPPEAFEYRLGNRSALDWIIDQYQVSTDKRSGIVNDPNNPEDQEYIVKLIGKVITVSLETMKTVKGLPTL